MRALPGRKTSRRRRSSQATSLHFDPDGNLAVVCQWAVSSGALASKGVWTQSSAGAQTASGWSSRRLEVNGTDIGIDIAADGSGLLWGNRTPVYVSASTGSTWSPTDVMDGDARIGWSGSALGGGVDVLLVWDPDRSAALLLRTLDGGRTWSELAAFHA
jgi:hypothetical protein